MATFYSSHQHFNIRSFIGLSFIGENVALTVAMPHMQGKNYKSVYLFICGE